MDERAEYDRFARWLLDADLPPPERIDPYVLFEAWKAGVHSVRNADSAPEANDGTAE